jgi:RNA polymerase sigma-70 factor (ECF subfamily)
MGADDNPDSPPAMSALAAGVAEKSRSIVGKLHAGMRPARIGPSTMPKNQNLTSIYLSCRGHLARVVSRLVPPHEIEDIVQETYVRVCRFRAGQYGSGRIRKPRALMVQVARNLALDHLKRAETRLTSSLDEDLASSLDANARRVDQTYRQAASDEEFAQFCEAVRQLPQQCRRVFVLKKVYGYSQREIAAKLELSESTVEKHISKGMKLCTQFLLGEGRDAKVDAPALRRAAARQGGRR